MKKILSAILVLLIFVSYSCFANKNGEITTHVLDIKAGRPASGVPVTLFILINKKWKKIANNVTDQNGRITFVLPNKFAMKPHIFELYFKVAQYFTKSFFPYIKVDFHRQPGQYYHVPILISPYGYTTYRGS